MVERRATDFLYLLVTWVGSQEVVRMDRSRVSSEEVPWGGVGDLVRGLYVQRKCREDEEKVS